MMHAHPGGSSTAALHATASYPRTSKHTLSCTTQRSVLPLWHAHTRVASAHPVRLFAGAAAAALQLENSRLREEVDSLKRRLPALGLLRRTSSNMQLAGAATEQLVAEVAQVW
jgi:hypothetical protein